MPTTNGHEVVTGCVLDNHFGWHNHARMIYVAHDLGWPLSLEDHQLVDQYDHDEGAVDFEVINDLMDEAEEWLNDHSDGDILWHWRDGDFMLSPFCQDGDCGEDDCAHCWPD